MSARHDTIHVRQVPQNAGGLSSTPPGSCYLQLQAEAAQPSPFEADQMYQHSLREALHRCPFQACGCCESPALFQGLHSNQM